MEAKSRALSPSSCSSNPSACLSGHRLVSLHKQGSVDKTHSSFPPICSTYPTGTAAASGVGAPATTCLTFDYLHQLRFQTVTDRASWGLACDELRRIGAGFVEAVAALPPVCLEIHHTLETTERASLKKAYQTPQQLKTHANIFKMSPCNCASCASGCSGDCSGCSCSSCGH